MTSGSVPKLIISFALPLLAAEFLQELHYSIDSFVAGNFFGEGGTEAIAAIGASWHVLLLLLSFLIGYSIGGSVVIAQFVGACKEYRLAETVTTLTIGLIILAPIISVVSIIFAEDVLRLLHVPSEVLPSAAAYLRVMLAGFIFLGSYSQISAIFRGLGDSITPLHLVLVSVATNLVLNLLLIAIFHASVVVLAIATVIAQGIACTVGFFILVNKYKLIPKKVSEWKFNIRIWLKVMRVSVPIGIEMMVAAGSLLAISVFINSSGTNVIAAVSIAQTIDELVIVMGVSLSGAVSVFVGQNIAAERMDRVVKGIKVGIMLSLGFAVIATAAALFGDRILASWFTDNQAVWDIVEQYLLIVSLFYVINTTTLVLTGTLQGAGKAFIPMLVSLISLWAVRVPLTWLLSDYFELGTKGIWWSQVIAWCLCLVLVALYMISGRWKPPYIVPKEVNKR